MIKRSRIIFFLCFFSTIVLFAVGENPSFQKGVQYYLEKKFLLAIGSFKAAADSGFQDPRLYVYLGNSYAANEDYDKSIESYKMAVETASSPVFQGRVYYNMAYIMDLKGDYPKAIETYSKAYSLDGSLAEVFRQKGSDYYRLKDKTNVIQQWEQYLAVLPNGPESANVRKALAFLKDPVFDFTSTNLLSGQASAGSSNDGGTNSSGPRMPTVDSLIDIQGVLDTVKPADKGTAEDQSVEDIEK